MTKHCITFAALVLAAACAEDLREDPVDAGMMEPDGGGSATGPLVHEELGDGVVRTTVDATGGETWIYLDLEGREHVAPSSPDDSIDWDLAFQRFHVKSNGGVSGTGGAQISFTDGVSFDDVTEAPSTGWAEDAADGEDDDEVPEYVISGNPDPWYAYDAATHELSPKERVYFVRTVERGYFALAIEDYYDDAGTSGFLTFRWAPVDPPSGGGGGDLTVDASASGTWVYLSLADLGLVTPADPATDPGWDVAFQRTMIQTSSGTSGSGNAGALEPMIAFDDIAAAPADGYAVDEMLPLPGPPGSGEYSGNPVLNTWYDYDPSTHAVSPRDAAFIVRSADGERYFAFQIVGWADGVYDLRIEERPVEE